jgi:hypothetical protein
MQVAFSDIIPSSRTVFPLNARSAYSEVEKNHLAHQPLSSGIPTRKKMKLFHYFDNEISAQVVLPCQWL